MYMSRALLPWCVWAALLVRGRRRIFSEAVVFRSVSERVYVTVCQQVAVFDAPRVGTVFTAYLDEVESVR